MRDSVAVIGAGPVGLFTALLLAQNGIKVTVCEAGSGIDQSPRAVAYFPPVLEEFEKAGIIKDVINAGEKNADGCDWRDADGRLIAGIDPPPNDPNFTVCLSQPELGEILLQKVIQTGNAEVLFDQEFKRLKQGDGSVTYWTRNKYDSHDTERTCRLLIGADGGRSSVRRSLGIELEGHTFENLQFVAVNFQYPLKEAGWKAANYIVDPIDWGVVVKRGKGTSWRLATGVTTSGLEKKTTLDTATIKTVKDRLSRILPGDTNKIEYEAMSPYVVHQRCATRFREGNVLLAGDAAHLNNPVGGLGLTTGLLDAAHLAKAVQEFLAERADSVQPLETYAETRRRIFLDRTNPISTANVYRLFSQDPAHVKERAEDFVELKDPKNFLTKIRLGLPDFSLSSTSERLFDTYGEVTWFISVTRIPEWSNEKFQHEYRTVHANMTRQASLKAPVIRRYIQLSNSRQEIRGTDRPEWDYVTCLTWPSLFVVHAGFKNPEYRANAGAHIFCRQDQQGCFMAQVDKYSSEPADMKDDVAAVQCLVYHKKGSLADHYPATWFTERATRMKAIAAEKNVQTYILWRDVTPQNIDYFFRDTQFVGGSWLKYKALETFAFENESTAAYFFEKHGEDIFGNLTNVTQTVIGVPSVVI